MGDPGFPNTLGAGPGSCRADHRPAGGGVHKRPYLALFRSLGGWEVTDTTRALLLLRCQRLQELTDYCRDLAGPPVPHDLRQLRFADLVAKRPDLVATPAGLGGLDLAELERLYEHLEAAQNAVRDATLRVAVAVWARRREEVAPSPPKPPAPPEVVLHPGFEAAVPDLFRPGQAAKEGAFLEKVRADPDWEPAAPRSCASCAAPCTEEDWRGSGYYCSACWAGIEPARRAWEARQRGPR